MDPLTFIQQLYDSNSIAGYADGWGFHPFNYAVSGQVTDGLGWTELTQLPQQVIQRGDSAAAQFWITATGDATAGPLASFATSDVNGWSDESQQASWVSGQLNAYKATLGNAVFIWSLARDVAPYPVGYTGIKATAASNTPWPAANDSYFGLLHNNFSAKPAMSTFTVLAGGANVSSGTAALPAAVVATATVPMPPVSTVSPVVGNATVILTTAQSPGGVAKVFTPTVASADATVTTVSAIAIATVRVPTQISTSKTVAPVTVTGLATVNSISYTFTLAPAGFIAQATIGQVFIAEANSINVRPPTFDAVAEAQDHQKALEVFATFFGVDTEAVIGSVKISTVNARSTTQYSAPSLSGVMAESPAYRSLGVGLTDRVFLLGHGDGLGLNNPYQITSIQDGVNKLAANPDSSLVRGMIEAYYGGARDMWLVQVAPMQEYVDDVSQRPIPGIGRGPQAWGNDDGDLQIELQYGVINDLRAQRGMPPFFVPTEDQWNAYNFYERYQARLDVAYEFLTTWDLPQIIIPLQAVYYDAAGVDFLGQLSAHCGGALALTGAVRIGLLGTRYDHLTISDDQAVANMAHDNRTNEQGNNGKFVGVLAGEGILNLKEFATMYSTPMAASVAGVLSSLPLNRGLTYEKLPNVLSIVGSDMTVDQIDSLTQAQLNPVARIGEGRRGQPFNVAVLTDNTMGTTGTDYWSLVQLRLIAQCVERIRSLGLATIGTIGFGEFKRSVQRYLDGLVQSKLVRGFNVNVVQDINDRSRVLVDVDLQPYFGVRNLSFTTTVGPAL